MHSIACNCITNLSIAGFGELIELCYQDGIMSWGVSVGLSGVSGKTRLWGVRTFSGAKFSMLGASKGVLI